MTSTLSDTLHNHPLSEELGNVEVKKAYCSYNRFRRRFESEALLWPNYVSYVRHPQATNFFILPSCFEKVQQANSLSHSQPRMIQQPVSYRFHPTTHGEWTNPSPSYHTPTSHYPISYLDSHSKKSKRKYEELQEINAEDPMFSVFLDFDNVA